ncbi:hypothetical protein R3P38DRAFT_2767613 [Favolaschia claudopus]|uniref:Uncharacterized protein n=1 Tax=Favolaschia claudopus TaxID=2862362 RepID=A0AAW0CYC5_9AGAR
MPAAVSAKPNRHSKKPYANEADARLSSPPPRASSPFMPASIFLPAVTPEDLAMQKARRQEEEPRRKVMYDAVVQAQEEAAVSLNNPLKRTRYHDLLRDYYEEFGLWIPQAMMPEFLRRKKELDELQAAAASPSVAARNGFRTYAPFKAFKTALEAFEIDFLQYNPDGSQAYGPIHTGLAYELKMLDAFHSAVAGARTRQQIDRLATQEFHPLEFQNPYDISDPRYDALEMKVRNRIKSLCGMSIRRAEPVLYRGFLHWELPNPAFGQPIDYTARRRYAHYLLIAEELAMMEKAAANDAAKHKYAPSPIKANKFFNKY